VAKDDVAFDTILVENEEVGDGCGEGDKLIRLLVKQLKNRGKY
jgi:hypothetical protein